MDDLLGWLSGKKTYLLAGIAILGTWVAYALGAPDPACVPSAANACTAAVSLQGAIAATLAALGFITIRRGMKTEAAATVAVMKEMAPATAAKAVAKARK